MRSPTDADAAESSPYAAPLTEIADPLLHAPPRTGGDVLHVGFWPRTAAAIIDLALAGVLGVILMIVAGIAGNFVISASGIRDSFFWLMILGSLQLAIAPVVLVVYLAWFHASSSRATPGKMALGIKLVRADGSAVSFMRGCMRGLALLLAALPLGGGLILVAFSEGRRGLHDRLCDTRVVDRWAYTAHPQRQRAQLGVVGWLALAFGASVSLAVAYVLKWLLPYSFGEGF